MKREIKARIIRQQARRLPIHQRAEAEAEVNKMLKRGIIELSSSHGRHHSPREEERWHHKVLPWTTENSML